MSNNRRHLKSSAPPPLANRGRGLQGSTPAGKFGPPPLPRTFIAPPPLPRQASRLQKGSGPKGEVREPKSFCSWSRQQTDKREIPEPPVLAKATPIATANKPQPSKWRFPIIKLLLILAIADLLSTTSLLRQGYEKTFGRNAGSPLSQFFLGQPEPRPFLVIDQLRDSTNPQNAALWQTVFEEHQSGRLASLEILAFAASEQDGSSSEIERLSIAGNMLNTFLRIEPLKLMADPSVNTPVQDFLRALDRHADKRLTFEIIAHANKTANVESENLPIGFGITAEFGWGNTRLPFLRLIVAPQPPVVAALPVGIPIAIGLPQSAPFQPPSIAANVGPKSSSRQGNDDESRGVIALQFTDNKGRYGLSNSSSIENDWRGILGFENQAHGFSIIELVFKTDDTRRSISLKSDLADLAKGERKTFAVIGKSASAALAEIMQCNLSQPTQVTARFVAPDITTTTDVIPDLSYFESIGGTQYKLQVRLPTERGALPAGALKAASSKHEPIRILLQPVQVSVTRSMLAAKSRDPVKAIPPPSLPTPLSTPLPEALHAQESSAPPRNKVTATASPSTFFVRLLDSQGRSSITMGQTQRQDWQPLANLFGKPNGFRAIELVFLDESGHFGGNDHQHLTLPMQSDFATLMRNGEVTLTAPSQAPDLVDTIKQRRSSATPISVSVRFLTRDGQSISLWPSASNPKLSHLIRCTLRQSFNDSPLALSLQPLVIAEHSSIPPSKLTFPTVIPPFQTPNPPSQPIKAVSAPIAAISLTPIGAISFPLDRITKFTLITTDPLWERIVKETRATDLNIDFYPNEKQGTPSLGGIPLALPNAAGTRVGTRMVLIGKEKLNTGDITVRSAAWSDAPQINAQVQAHKPLFLRATLLRESAVISASTYQFIISTPEPINTSGPLTISVTPRIGTKP